MPQLLLQNLLRLMSLLSRLKVQHERQETGGDA